MTAVCRCGHSRRAHRHHRRGSTWCSLCPPFLCVQWKRRWLSWLTSAPFWDNYAEWKARNINGPSTYRYGRAA